MPKTKTEMRAIWRESQRRRKERLNLGLPKRGPGRPKGSVKDKAVPGADLSMADLAGKFSEKAVGREDVTPTHIPQAMQSGEITSHEVDTVYECMQKKRRIRKLAFMFKTAELCLLGLVATRCMHGASLWFLLLSLPTLLVCTYYFTLSKRRDW